MAQVFAEFMNFICRKSFFGSFWVLSQNNRVSDVAKMTAF
jgi:hypothetical protein